MSDDLANRVAIVTGGSGGIGRAVVKAFVEHGMRVGICDIDAKAVADMEAEYGRDRALAVPADIADPHACSGAVRQVAAHFGGLHVLINNAALGMGAVRSDHFTRTVQIEDIGVELWQSFMAVNMSGAFYLAKAAVPIFRGQSWGRIINVTTSFFTMLRPGFSPYGPAKAALEAWSASLAGELEGTGITVNVVVPGGPADTPMVPQTSGFDRGQLIAPARMAAPMMWLCSDAGSRATGRRFVAAEWDEASMTTGGAPARMGPIAWPDLGRTPVWPVDGPPPHFEEQMQPGSCATRRGPE